MDELNVGGKNKLQELRDKNENLEYQLEEFKERNKNLIDRMEKIYEQIGNLNNAIANLDIYISEIKSLYS